MIKVLFLPEVVDQFLELAEVLYNKGYLGSCHMDKAFLLIIPRNHHTTWYVFYSVHEVDDQTIYLVRYLGNNHTLGHKLSD